MKCKKYSKNKYNQFELIIGKNYKALRSITSKDSNLVYVEVLTDIGKKRWFLKDYYFYS